MPDNQRSPGKQALRACALWSEDVPSSHSPGRPRAHSTAARLLRPTQQQGKPAEPAMLFLTSGEASQEAEPENAIPKRPEPAARVTPLRSVNSSV